MIYSDQQLKEMIVFLKQKALKQIKAGLFFTSAILLVEGIVFMYVFDGDFWVNYMLIGIGLVLLFPVPFINRRMDSYQNYDQLNDIQWFQQIPFEGLKIPVYSYVQKGRNRSMELRVLGISDHMIALYKLNVQLRQLMIESFSDVTFQLFKDKRTYGSYKKVFKMRTPRKTYRLYLTHLHEQKLYQYLLSNEYLVTMK